MFVTASHFWFTTLLKMNTIIDVSPLSFTNLAQAVISRNTLEWSLLWVFITFHPYLVLKTALIKLFGNCRKSFDRLQLYILIWFFSLSFAKILTAVFQNIDEFLFLEWLMPAKKKKKNVGKKKVSERSSFDNLFSVISLTSSSITINL